MIIAVDPGKTTGLFAVIGDFHMPYVNCERPALDAMCGLNDLIRHNPNREEIYVVCERYVQQSTKLTPQYDALEVIGVVKWLTLGLDLTMQSRSQKSLVTDDMLRNIGWWTSGTRGHVNDAARHALIWLTSRNPNHTLVRRAIGTIATTG